MSFGQELKDFAAAFSSTGKTLNDMQMTKSRSGYYDALTKKANKPDPVDEAFKTGRDGVPAADTSKPAIKEPGGVLPVDDAEDGAVDDTPAPQAAAPGYDGGLPDEMKAASAGAAKGAPSMDGSDPSDHMIYLVGKSKDPKIAAAMLGNAWQESGLNPTITGDHDKGGSFGLYQFNAHGRKPEFDKWAAANKRDPNTSDAQHDFVLYDLQKNFPKVWKAMQAAPTPEAASDVFETGYERPNPKMANSAGRRKRAVEAFKLFEQPSGQGAIAEE